MRRLLALLITLHGLSGLAFGQSSPGQIDPGHTPALGPHFDPELAFDAPTDPQRWTREPAGLHAAFGSTDEIYFRSEVPAVGTGATAWEATGWKGERLNAIVLVWSPDDLQQVRVEPTDLTDAKGNVLSRDNIRLQVVRYVLSNYPARATNATCDAGSSSQAWLLPDRLEPLDRFDTAARTVRPVWLSLDIPRTAEAGTYEGSAAVQSRAGTVMLRLKVTVQTQVLPAPSDWRFRLDLWQNPWVIAWYYNLRPWSDEHKALLKQHLKLYADAGGKFITTYAVHSPWQDNSYMIEGGMIDWIRQKDGSWRFDYRIFDEYVSLAIEAGINKAITIYTPLPWANRFRYLDKGTGNIVEESWPPESDAFKGAWHAFLDDLKQHLEHKGWLARTYLGINENPLDQTLAAIKVIKDHWPQWKITYAGDWHAQLDGLVDDYSSVQSKEPATSDIQARSTKGATTTYYVCCTPPKPNTFVFSPPAEARYLGWYTAAHGYDGFLRWAYDAWAADPVRDARHVLWPAGDTFLVYPGSQSSIRFERLREGIVDFEKIRLLRSWASRSTDGDVKRLASDLEQALSAVASDRDFDEAPLRANLVKGTRALVALSDQLTR
jgi:Glycoside hydrolase 123, catalytic domain/Glycoside hydrolase 123 N-terminal domain